MKNALAKTVFTGCEDSLEERSELTLFIQGDDQLYLSIENRVKRKGKKETKYSSEIVLDLETCHYLSVQLDYLVTMLKESQGQGNGE
jgi:hypothetical protein